MSAASWAALWEVVCECVQLRCGLGCGTAQWQVQGAGGWVCTHTGHLCKPRPGPRAAWLPGPGACSWVIGKNQKKVLIRLRFWLFLRPFVPLGPLSLAPGVTSPCPVPPPGPVAMQLGLAGGWRHTDALFCLLGRPGMSERAMSFPPRKGPPGAMVFSQFPWKGTATTPCPQHVLEAGTLSRAQAHGRSARWPLRICPGLRGASTLPGQGSRHAALTAAGPLTPLPSLQSFQGSQGRAYLFNSV